jgi:DNA modification methylase
MDWRHVEEILAAGKQAHTKLRDVVAWVKDNESAGSLYRNQHELIFVFQSGQAEHANDVELGKYRGHRTNVWNYPDVTTDERNLGELHRRVKPVALVADAIMDCSTRGDIVLDPFLGSGTTLIAAERTGRVCYGMELDPRYVDVTVRRWRTFTGLGPTHVASGRSFADLEQEAASEQQ